MRKFIFGIAGIIAVVLPVVADDIDMSEIKAACESSYELLWDESNEYCVPRNPCLDETGTYSQYCNWKTFENVSATFFREWFPLVKIYAKTHGLNCELVYSDGDNFVWCKGKDLKVFRFHNAANKSDEELEESFAKSKKYDFMRVGKAFKDAICKNALGGQIVNVQDGYGYECNVSASKCDVVKNVLKEDAFFANKATVIVNPGTGNCVITTSID